MTPDPLTPLLLAAVPQLGAPSFAARHHATAALRDALPLSAPALAWGGRSDGAETAARCRHLLGGFAAERLAEHVEATAATLLAEQGGAWPSIFHLPWGIEGVWERQTHYLARTTTAAHPTGDTEAATGLYVRDLLRSGAPAEDVRKLLAQMRENEGGLPD